MLPLNLNMEVMNDRLGDCSNPESSLRLFESLDPNMKAISDMMGERTNTELFLKYFLSRDCLLVLMPMCSVFGEQGRNMKCCYQYSLTDLYCGLEGHCASSGRYLAIYSSK
jgi:hypothetical protein